MRALEQAGLASRVTCTARGVLLTSSRPVSQPAEALTAAILAGGQPTGTRSR